MKTKPDFKFGDQVVFIGDRDRQKRGVVSRVFWSGRSLVASIRG